MANSCRSPLLGLIALFAGLAHPVLLPAHAAEPAAREARGDRTAARSQGVEGLASFYAKRFNGKRTTSGEKHRPDALTAAHPDLPLGTKVRVVHLGNDRETVVRVNDRCRRRKTPIIDLSRAAAQELGLLKEGKARVRIIPLPRSTPEP